MRSQTFLYEIQFRTTFIQSFFDGCVFLAVLGPKLNVICCFITIYNISITWYKKFENSIFCPVGVIFSTIISVLNVRRTILPIMALKQPLINLQYAFENYARAI